MLLVGGGRGEFRVRLITVVSLNCFEAPSILKKIQNKHKNRISGFIQDYVMDKRRLDFSVVIVGNIYYFVALFFLL